MVRVLSWEGFHVNEKKLYRLKPSSFEAMLHDGDTADMMAVYQWVEANTQGSFDPFSVATTGSGVSIDPATGQMMISTVNGVIFVKKGEWVINLGDGQFTKCDHNRFAIQYETMDGSDMPQPVPVEDTEEDPEGTT